MIVMETARLILREYEQGDFDALYAILSDPETMRHYPKPYDAAGTQRWLDWNFDNYRTHGFGLWALVRREDGRFLGDCGLTMQRIDGEERPEIGYHVDRHFWRQGYAGEAARAVRDWGFTRTAFDCLYSYMHADNEASCATARAAGLRLIGAYDDERWGPMKVLRITRAEWEQLKEGH